MRCGRATASAKVSHRKQPLFFLPCAQYSRSRKKWQAHGLRFLKNGDRAKTHSHATPVPGRRKLRFRGRLREDHDVVFPQRAADKTGCPRRWNSVIPRRPEKADVGIRPHAWGERIATTSVRGYVTAQFCKHGRSRFGCRNLCCAGLAMTNSLEVPPREPLFQNQPFVWIS